MNRLTELKNDLPTYEVIPLVGVGGIRLGMTRDEVRAALNLPFESFQKTVDAPAFTDAFHKSGLQVFYDEAGRAEYIELSSGVVRALYKGTAVFETQAEEVVALVLQDAAYDPEDAASACSYIFPDLEMSLWRPYPPEAAQDEDDPDGRFFSTVGVGRQGYYSDDLA